MNRDLVVAIALLSVALGGLEAAAAPAAPIIVKLTQDDGSVFKAAPRGDEYGSWMEALDGHTIVKSGATWYYAVLDANGGLVRSALRVGSPNLRSLGAIPEGLHPSTDSVDRITGPKRSIAPASKTPSGMTEFATSPHTQPLLVVLMEFNNRTLTGGTAAATTAFSNLIFGASSSVTDFYDETSFGNFDVVPAAESYGTANDGIVIASYGANHPNSGSNFGPVAAVIAAAFSDADPFVNYASFDTNLDGDLTPEELSVVVIWAGYETSYGGASSKTPNVWGHMSATSGYTSADSGTTLSWYTAFGEQHAIISGSDDIATIGIMCHELGHLMFGLPDLYDTDSSSEGIGEWGLMGSGSWNGLVRSGDCPAHLEAWSKVVTGMVTPSDIMSAATGVEFAPNYGVADIKRLWIDPYRVREHFLLENRQLISYDNGLPGNGLLVWHIDGSRTGNSTDTRRLVDLEEADGLNHLDSKTNRGDGGDPFPGTSAKTTFNGTSNPNSDTNAGADTGIAVTSISASAPSMTADLTPNLTGGVGDNIRYDEGGADGYGWGGGTNTRWSALRVTNSSSEDQLEGLEVYTVGSGTVDAYIYASMTSNTPTTLLTSKLGNATVPGWNRILLTTPVGFAAASDRIIVLKITDPGSGGYPLRIDINAPHSGRWWDDADGIGAFAPRSLYDLNQVALVGTAGPNVAPTVVSSNRVSATPSKLATVNFTVTFSESVVGVNAADFSLTTTGGIAGAAIGTVSGNGATRTVAVTTGTGNGTIRLDVLNDGTIVDLAVSPLPLAAAFSSGQTYTIDKTVPSVVLTSVPANPTGAAPVNVTATFSESVTGFVSADVTKTNATVSSFAGSGAVYTFVLDPSTVGTNATAIIAAGKASDAAGNTNTISNTLTVLENVPPAVVVSNRVSATPSALATVQFAVTFSQTVVGVDASDFSLTTTGLITGAAVGAVSGSGSGYTVSVGTGTLGGTIRLNVLNDGTIKDFAGNALAAAFLNGQSYTISKTPPTVVLTSVPASPAGTAPVDVTATFSEAVTGFVSTGITVTNATVSGFAGSDAVYTFVLTPATAGTSATAIVAAGKAIDIEGDINTASNTLVVLENVSPTVVGSNRVSATPSKLTAIKFTVTFSESVTGVNAADFSLTTTGLITGAAVGTIGGTGATRTVSVSTGTGDGTIRLNVLNDGTIKDLAGNALAAAFSSGQTYTIDKSRPSVVLSSTAPNPTTTAPFLVTVTFSEPVTTFVSTDITKTNATVSSFSGSGAVYTFMLDPIALGTATATVAAGKAKDAVALTNTASNILSRTIQ